MFSDFLNFRLGVDFLEGGFCHDPSADGYTPKTNFTSFITRDCVNRYTYLIPNGIIYLLRIEL